MRLFSIFLLLALPLAAVGEKIGASENELLLFEAAFDGDVAQIKKQAQLAESKDPAKRLVAAWLAWGNEPVQSKRDARLEEIFRQFQQMSDLFVSDLRLFGTFNELLLHVSDKAS